MRFESNSCLWLVSKLAPLCQPMRSKIKTNRSLLVSMFPVLYAGCMHLLWILIGSLLNLCLLCLASVITLVLAYDPRLENSLWWAFCRQTLFFFCRYTFQVCLQLRWVVRGFNAFSFCSSINWTCGGILNWENVRHNRFLMRHDCWMLGKFQDGFNPT